jgi:hypothetical protein
MGFLTIVIIVGLVWYSMRVGFNFGSLVGGIIGVLIGSSLGIAGGGSAVNGWIIFGAIGFVIGGLVFKNWRNTD